MFGPRRIVVVNGVVWTVRLIASQYDRRRSDLIFETDSVIRRVRSYPVDWHTLSDAELLAVSEGL